MITNGVSEPVTEVSPFDGPVTVLPPQMWAEHQRAVMDGELAGNRREAIDLIIWEDDHYALGPKRAASPKSYSSTADCPDCHIVGPGKKTYCSAHACRALNSRGKPCPMPAREESGFLYCTHHGCHDQLAPGVGCMERSLSGHYYCDSHLPEYIR